MKKQFIILIFVLTHLSCGQKNDTELSRRLVEVSQPSTEHNSSNEKRNPSNKNSDDSITPITQHNEIIEWYKSYKSDGVKIYDDFGTDITAKLMTVINNYEKINTHKDRSDYGVSFFEEDNVMVEVKKYNINEKLAKITTEKYEKQSRSIAEYYLLNGKVSFVFEVRSLYNRPYDYDKKTAKANNDTEYFDIEKSSVTVFGHFFHNGKLFHTVISDVDTKNQVIISNEEDLKSEYEKIMKRFTKMTE